MNYSKRKMLLVGVLAGLLGVTGCGDDDGDTTTDTNMDMGPGTDGGDGEDMGGIDGGGEEPRVCTIAEPTPPAEAGCPDVASRTVVTVDADITADTTWTCDNLYELGAQIYVTGGATLTIEPGVVVHGGGGGDEGQNALIVTTEGSIDAVGTSVDPIVFTSSNPEGVAAPGDWGGVVLLGNAPINVTGGTNLIEGLDPSEARGEYGGDDATHDCGTLSYVRIEFAGFLFGTDNELNGLTLGGCGTGTELDFIQVHAGKDDGIEFFGGTAGITHAVVSQVGDDGLDWDQGWAGDVQFLVIQQDTISDKGIEADNLGDNNDATPRSNPTIWNMTIVGTGSSEQEGLRLRRGTAGMINNAIVTNYGGSKCIRVDGSATIVQANEGNLVVQDSIVSDCGTTFEFTPDDGDTTTTFTGDWDAINDTTSNPFLADPTNLSAPDFTPNGLSAAKTGAVPGAGFDAAADFVGAVEPGCWNWTAGWTAYPAPAE